MLVIPPVEVAAAIWPLELIATAPTVPYLELLALFLCVTSSLQESFDKTLARNRTKKDNYIVELGCFRHRVGINGVPVEIANSLAASPARNTCSVFSITFLANEIGFPTFLTQPTAPILQSVYSIFCLYWNNLIIFE